MKLPFASKMSTTFSWFRVPPAQAYISVEFCSEALEKFTSAPYESKLIILW